MISRLIFTVLFVILSLAAFSQFTERIDSYPDSAAVYLNEELQCYTPCKVKYYWRQKKDGVIIIKVKADGYQDWEKRINSKPTDFDDRSTVYLTREFKQLEKNDLPLIAFDKLVVNFKDGQKIGQRKLLKKPAEDIEWKGSVKVGDETFSEMFIETATNMGLNTLLRAYTELFSEEVSREKRLPRFIIGVELTDMNIDIKQVKTKGTFEPMVTKTKLGFKWSVLDKKSGQVVMSKSNEAEYRFRQETYQSLFNVDDVYEIALIDFLGDPEFLDLLKNNENLEPIQELDKPGEKIMIESAPLSKFESFSEMVKASTGSCVTIITDGGHGSGAMIDADGVILTAYHVLEGVNKIEVKFNNGIQIPAEILSFNKKSDVALIKVNGSGFNALPIYTKSDYGIGDEVATIGTPADLELGQSLSKGIISGKRKNDDRVFIQLDMSVSPGNSGGPLLNKDGEVIGVVLSKIVDEGVEGIGFAVPIDVLIRDLNMEIK